jgi:Family of unknown function (DUF6496)
MTIPDEPRNQRSRSCCNRAGTFAKARVFTFRCAKLWTGFAMATRYSRGASKDVEREMHKFKRGTLRSGKGGKGGKVKRREQAIAIGLSEARREGKRVPPKSAGGRSKSTRSTAARKSAHRQRRKAA